ncbi:MAG: hypothetical protein SGILL_010888, partial [Bacillariaceae sp.]
KSKKQRQPTTTFHLQNSGQDLEADHVIWTTGITSQNHAFLSSDKLSKKGFVKVDECFRVVVNDIESSSENSNTKLFAFGDCCDLLPNSGSQVLGAMHVLGHNLNVAVQQNVASKAEMNNNADDDHEETDPLSTPTEKPQKTKKLRKALAQPELYICTVGEKDGVALTPFGGTGLALPRLKNKTFFLGKAKKSLG